MKPQPHTSKHSPRLIALPARPYQFRKDKLIIRDKQAIRLLSKDQIVYCASDSNYTRIHLRSGQHILLCKCLKAIAENLPESNFLRIHASYLINLDYLQKVNLTPTKTVLMENNARLPISRSRYSGLASLFINKETTKLMSKFLFLFIFSCFITQGLAQSVGINATGATPNSSAILDVTSTSKGVLIPRMSTFQRTQISSPAHGLLVFDTNKNSFMYYDTSDWIEISGGNIDELTDEDDDTSVKVEANTDEDKIRFVVDGNEGMILQSNVHNESTLHMGGANNNVCIGEGAGVNIGPTPSVTGARNSTFIGVQAGNLTTLGVFNTFIGYQSGMSNSYGISNSFVGMGAGTNNSTGDRNTFLGIYSGYRNTIGDNNVSLGGSANFYNEQGHRNTIIGYNAGRGVSPHNKSGNIFLGNEAGYYETSDDKLYIENSNSTSPLIYGEFDNDLLRINGSLQIKNEYTFPSVDGTAGQFLSTNGLGALSWASTTTNFAFLKDADGDTQIQVEETPDENKIRFDIEGTERFVIEENASGEVTISVKSSSFNTFLGDGAGLNNDISVFPDGGWNTFVGYAAGTANASGSYNTYLGRAAGSSNQNGDFNAMLGSFAGGNFNNSFNNTMIGNNAGAAQTSGNENTYLGASAGTLRPGGNNNVLIGYRSGRSAAGNGDGNIMIGHNVGINSGSVSNRLYIENSSTNSPLIYGEFDNNFLKCNGDFASSGNIGVGINTADERLHIYSGSADVSAKIEAGTSDLSSLKLFESGDFGYELQYDGDTDKLHLWSRAFSGNEAVRMTWEKNGQIGIGVESPTGTLHIKQRSADLGLIIENDGDTDDWGFEIGNNDMNFRFNGSTVGFWDDATGNYVATSDRRLKKDITKFDGKTLDKIIRLSPVQYRLLHADAQSQKATGFIAQEVQVLFPELVAIKEDGTFGLHYPDFGVLAIKGIQELADRTEQQQGIIDLQQENISRLQTENLALKSTLENMLMRLESLESSTAKNQK